MPGHVVTSPGRVLRHFTVAVFVVHHERVLMHFHRNLHKWLPPGGHIEDDELPDDAAVREVLEETGVLIRLVGGTGLDGVMLPRQLTVPAGVQVEDIYPGHQHIDIVYFAAPADPSLTDVAADLAVRDRVGWYSAEEITLLGASAEIQAWARRAVRGATNRLA